MMFLPVSSLLTQGRAPDYPVAISDGEVINFARFHHDVCLFSQKLRGVEAKKFALAFDDSYNFSVAFFAVLYVGGTVILPPNVQPDTLSELKAQGVAVLRDHSIAALQDASRKYVGPTLLKLDAGEIVFYTSGSTGDPKVVRKNLHQIEAEISVLQDTWASDVADCLTIATVSHQHIYGLLFKVLWPLCAGRAFVTETALYWENVAVWSHEKCCLVSSPAHLSRFPDQFYLTADVVFSSGGPLSFEAATTTLTHLGIRPIEVYGSTETGGIAYRQQVKSTTPWTKFSVVDMAEKNGALRIQSPYLDTPDWYQTNDLVTLLSDHEFSLRGRNDRIAKIEGKRVSLIEVETWLRTHDWIEDASALCLTSGRKVLACVVILTPTGQEKLDTHGPFRFGQMLRREMHTCFDLAALPKRWRYVAKIPENTEGKRLHSTLAALFD